MIARGRRGAYRRQVGPPTPQKALFAYARIHRHNSGNVGALPCMRTPTRKIRLAAQTTMVVVAINAATATSTCQVGAPGGIAIRSIIANGVVVGKNDMPTASAESGARMTTNDPM